jgi:hypothetical protein
MLRRNAVEFHQRSCSGVPGWKKVGSGFYFCINTHMLMGLHNRAAQEWVMRKAPVSERALIQRLNRKIKEDDLVLKKCGPYSKAYDSLGDYYVVDIHQNMIVERRLDSTDLQSLGRAKKVLADWETIFEVLRG